MSVISIFSASYCKGKEIAEKLSTQLSYELVGDELLDLTAAKFNVSRNNILQAFYGTKSVFGMSSKNRRKFIAYYKNVLAEKLQADNIVYHGHGLYLIPKEISHVLRVCIAGDFGYRVKLAAQVNNISEDEAQSLIKEEDEKIFNWSGYITNISPWEKRLYDIIIPIDKENVDGAVNLIIENVSKDVVKTTDRSSGRMQDFVLASRVHAKLAKEKHKVDVKAVEGHVTVLIEKYSLRLERYKEELTKITRGVDGVKSVEIKIGPKFKMPSTYPPVDFEIPKKILLVDDEVEFVETLSERLQNRQIESKIAYNGEEALESIKDDQPEVMVLDLKMPGIGGLDVLRKVKNEHPRTEVIILTGHGSDKERNLAMELGAFAYLEKPVDINVLSDTMKNAYAKINREKDDED